MTRVSGIMDESAEYITWSDDEDEPIMMGTYEQDVRDPVIPKGSIVLDSAGAAALRVMLDFYMLRGESGDIREFEAYGILCAALDGR